MITEERTAARGSDIDDRVLEACQQGDRKAFQLLFEAYKDRTYSMALHFSGDEALAQDIAQQVFLKIFIQIKYFRKGSEFTTWLYRIVINTCIDEKRKRKRFIPFSHSSEVKKMVMKGSQEENYLQRLVEDSVKAAVTNLKPNLRLPILLKYIEGLSYEEIARILGCSVGTVASRLNQAYKTLAQKLAHLRGIPFSGE
ncbi:MAG: sigma-70 family RNA polymerase sigma factor [Acidobacteriota bacterium]